MRKEKLIAWLILGLVLALGFSLFIRHTVWKEKEQVVTLRVWEGEKTLLHLPLYVALSEGYFDQQGIKVLLTNGTGADNDYPDQSVADLVLTDPVVYLYHKSLQPGLMPVVAVVACREGTFLLAREQGDFTWSSLEGKRIISYPPETGPGLAFDKTLRDNGLAPYRDTTLYNRIPADLRLGAFKAGSADYIQLSGPAALAAEESGAGSITAPVGNSNDAFPAVLCTATPETIKNQPTALQAFVNALYKAQLYMAEEPELGLQAAREHLDRVGRTHAPALLQRYTGLGMWQPQPRLEKDVFNDIVKAMESAGQLPAPVEYDNAVDNTFVHRAMESVKYIPPAERDKNWLQKLFG